MSEQTLAQRLSEGKLPPVEALRYSMVLAEALRRAHDEGRPHGAVCPTNIVLQGGNIELCHKAELPEIIPYAAPEILQGQPPDARSDLFSFGATLYEMLTGRRAFDGADRSAPASSGSPAVDRLVMACVSHEPASRPQRFQKVMLELKLMLVGAQRASVPSARAADIAAVRGDLGKLESRLADRLNANEKALAELQRLAADTASRTPDPETLKIELLQLEDRLATRLHAVERAVAEPNATLRGEIRQLDARISEARTEAGQIEERIAARLSGEQSDVARAMSEARAAAQTDLDQLEARLSGRIFEQAKGIAECRDLASGAISRADVEQIVARISAQFAEQAKAIIETREYAATGISRSEIDQIVARISGQFAEQAKAMNDIREHAAGAISRSEIEQLTARISAQIGDQVNAVAEARNAATRGMEELEARLTARIAEQVQAMQAGHAADTAAAKRGLVELEARLVAHGASQEQAIAESRNAAAEAMHGLRAQVSEIAAQLEAARQTGPAMEEAILHFREGMESLSHRLATIEAQQIGGEAARIEQMEQGVDGVRRQITELHDLVAQDLLTFEQTLKAHASSIDSARTAMAQTDDLVERVVEALETLQSAVLDQNEDRAVAVN